MFDGMWVSMGQSPSSGSNSELCCTQSIKKLGTVRYYEKRQRAFQFRGISIVIAKNEHTENR